MKKSVITFCAGMSVLSVVAQEAADTMAHELQEVVISAPKVIRKSDMDVYHPSASAVENSQNGMQLLRNLMIPTIDVNDALGTIQASGQPVQVRINGREATIDQVRALLPETVKRVEWIDNPGLRYNGASYVLNFVVVNPTVGGSLMAYARPALNTSFGFYNADAKFNIGRSQWQVGANYKLTNRIASHRDYCELFTYPDGSELARREIPRSGFVDNTFGNAWISYSYIKPDTTVLFVEATAHHDFTDRLVYNGRMLLSNGAEDLLLTDEQGDNGTKPQLSAYLEQHMDHGQILVADFKTSLYFGRTYSSYIESLENGNNITDIQTNIKDRNQVYAVEADYIKNWRNARMTAGASYTANRNRSVYENLGGEIFHQRQDRVYFFAEYFHRINKFTVTAGIGAQYTDFMFMETGQGNNSWNLRPQATITYTLSQNHQFRINFTSWQTAPTLAETNIAPQQTDGFQWLIGNPNLKTSNSYMLTLRYGFTLPRISGSFGVRAFTSPDAITPLLYWDDDRLVTTYENSRGLQNLYFFVAPQIEIIPQWVVASGYLQYRAERMRGTGYKHYNRAWSGNVTLQLMHYGFVISGQYMRASRNLYGEKISWGEDLSIIDISYNWKNWQFGAGMIMPFGKYDQGSRSLSKWNTNEQHMRLDMRIPYITVSYNIQWGRQKRGANKLINADAEVETSKAGSR